MLLAFRRHPQVIARGLSEPLYVDPWPSIADLHCSKLFCNTTDAAAQVILVMLIELRSDNPLVKNRLKLLFPRHCDVRTQFSIHCRNDGRSVERVIKISGAWWVNYINVGEKIVGLNEELLWNRLPKCF